MPFVNDGFAKQDPASGGGGGSTNASDLSSGVVSTTVGGTGANMAATGGAGHYVKQETVGGPFTTEVLSADGIVDLFTGTPDGTLFLRDDGTLAAPSSGGTDASALTTGTLAAARLPGVLANVDTQGELLSAAAAAAASHSHAASDTTSGAFNTARLAGGTATSGYVPKSNGDGTATWATDAGGASSDTVLTKTTTYTVDAADTYIRCNHASTPFTVTLYAATGSGKRVVIKNIGAAVVTIEGNASETIDGALNITLAQYSSVTLEDAASGAWDII